MVVFTHRDPVLVVLSMTAMLTYSARMHRSPLPVQELAASWVDRVQQMLGTLLCDRELIGPERSIDIRFGEFMTDEFVVAQHIYSLAGESLTVEAHKAMTRYLRGHQRGRLRRVATSAQMFGSTKAICMTASRRMPSGSWSRVESDV